MAQRDNDHNASAKHKPKRLVDVIALSADLCGIRGSAVFEALCRGDVCNVNRFFKPASPSQIVKEVGSEIHFDSFVSFRINY